MAIRALVKIGEYELPEPSTYSGNTSTLVDSARNAMGVMIEFLKEKGIEASYIRSWTENGVTYYDYGDWSRYCYTVPFYLSP